MSESGGSKVWLYVLGGCGAFGLLAGIAMCGGMVWLTGGNEGGVRLSNNMESYAIRYLDEQRVLEPGEYVVAYYDATIDLDGTEAAILTDRRLVYHQAGRNTAFTLEEIASIDHAEDALIGDVITVRTHDGRSMLIEIAPLNMGSLFLDELRARTSTY